MKKECKHEWHEINPFQKICCNCNQIANSEKIKLYTQKNLKHYTQCKDLERPTGPIILNELTS